MASRVIRGDLLSSRSLSRVSWQADWLFMRLLLAADDFGRLDGRLEIVRSVCFGNRTDVTMGEIDRWLTELTQCDPSGEGPLVRYEVDGWPYLQLRNWEKHRGKANRAESSKFPDPRESPRISAENSGDPRSGSGVLGSGLGGLVEEDAAQRTAAPRRSPLLNLLSKLDGSPREKELWLAENLPQIEIDALASRDEGAKPQTTAQLSIRYYRAYLRRADREFRTAERREIERAAVQAHLERGRAEREAEEARLEAEPVSAELGAQITELFRSKPCA